jgi:hypothetical protein
MPGAVGGTEPRSPSSIARFRRARGERPRRDAHALTLTAQLLPTDRKGRALMPCWPPREVALVLRQAQDDPELRRRVEIASSVRSRFELTRIARVLPAFETKHGYARRARKHSLPAARFRPAAHRATPTSASTTSTPSLSACPVGVRDFDCDTSSQGRSRYRAETNEDSTDADRTRKYRAGTGRRRPRRPRP